MASLRTSLLNDSQSSWELDRDHALRLLVILASSTSVEHLDELFPGFRGRLENHFGYRIAVEEEVMTQS